MTHIAFVHIEFPSGGGERITMDIARYLMRTYPGSYRISILTFSFREDLLPEEFKDSIRVHTVPDPGKDGQVAFTEKAIGIVRAEKIDILVQVGQIYLSLKDISRTTGCRTVFANHGRPLWEADFSMWERQQIAKRKLRRTILWFGLRKWIYLISGKTYRKVLGTYRRNYEESDAYVVLCGEYREKLVSALGCDPGRNKIAVIENPEYKVDGISFDRENEIIFVGRLTRFDKRVERLLKAWKLAQERLGGWNLAVIGDGEEYGYLKAMSSRLGLKRISFEGYRNPAPYYSRASISCLVSETEGWPLCLTEAQANGVIPVALDCSGGVRQILGPSGENGFLVRPGLFRERRFADTLVRVAMLPEAEKLRIRKNVIRKSAEYSIEIIGGKWKRLFDSLTEGDRF